jgi:hypothetical protein
VKQSHATVSTIEDVIDHTCFDRPSGSWHSGRFADGPFTVNISDVPFSIPDTGDFGMGLVIPGAGGPGLK